MSELFYFSNPHDGAGTMIMMLPEAERFTDPSVALIRIEGLNVQQTIYDWHSKTLLQLV